MGVLSVHPFMLNVENSLLAMTVLFNAGLAVFILRGNWGKPVNIFFGLLLASLAGRGVAAEAILFGKVAYAAALLVGAGFYYFSLAFPENAWPGTAAIALISKSYKWNEAGGKAPHSPPAPAITEPASSRTCLVVNWLPALRLSPAKRG